MDVKEQAIRGSIEKWHNILHADGEDKGGSNCPLCKEFNGEGKACEECPVAEKVGQTGCLDTPWIKWAQHHGETHLEECKYKVYCPTCRELAQAEYDFLKDLLIDYLPTRAKSDFCDKCGNTECTWRDVENILRHKGMVENCLGFRPLKKSPCKKEEWEDITEECRIQGITNGIRVGHDNYWICLFYANTTIMWPTDADRHGYQVQWKEGEEFRILKRV